MITQIQRNLSAVALAAVLLTMPLGAQATETSAQVPNSQMVQIVEKRISGFGRAQAYRGVSISKGWLRQVRLGGVLLNIRLHTLLGDEVHLREMLRIAPSNADRMCLYIQASIDNDVITMQLDQSAVNALKRLGICEIIVTDAQRYVNAHYNVDELDAVRQTLKLKDAELLCVSGEDAPVTVVNEDGVRRQAHL